MISILFGIGDLDIVISCLRTLLGFELESLSLWTRIFAVNQQREGSSPRNPCLVLAVFFGAEKLGLLIVFGYGFFLGLGFDALGQEVLQEGTGHGLLGL